MQHDEETIVALAAGDWRTLVIWECDLNDEATVLVELTSFLGPPRS